MARWRHCSCARCRIRGLMGPAILITAGVLFLINQYSWDYSIWRTWPIILIVVGLVKLLSDTLSTDGHVNPWETQPAAQSVGQAPPPPAAPPAL
jgi:cell wall-active antibiotic response 4TMS protein YvqF